MKISKRQLRRIIKEERRKLVNESVADMADFEQAIDEAAEKISWKFGDAMFAVFDEEPEMFQGRSTEAQWEQQVTSAQEVLAARISESISAVVEEIEMNLHDGQYSRG